jgi:hypothetical protein
VESPFATRSKKTVFVESMIFLTASRSKDDFVSFDDAVLVSDSPAVLLQEINNEDQIAHMAKIGSSCFIKKNF